MNIIKRESLYNQNTNMAKHTFIAARNELNAEIKKLKPLVEYLACYKNIKDIALKMFEEDGKAPPDGLYIKIHRIYQKLYFSDEYVCRVVIKATKEFVEQLELRLKNVTS